MDGRIGRLRVIRVVACDSLLVAGIVVVGSASVFVLDVATARI